LIAFTPGSLSLGEIGFRVLTVADQMFIKAEESSASKNSHFPFSFFHAFIFFLNYVVFFSLILLEGQCDMDWQLANENDWR
jgi:hypothetical protein